jgi:IS30 family transposase
MLVGLPDGRRADLVADALSTAITTLPRQLTRSLTWDQGHEMAAYAQFTIDTSVVVYFCDPKSPWQRGSAAATPMACCASTCPATSVSGTSARTTWTANAAELNGRPRQTLGIKTPSEALIEVLR